MPGRENMTITKTSPLGRESMAFQDKMRKYHAEIERMVYASEILCDSAAGCRFNKDTYCIFHDSENPGCKLSQLREAIGDHVKQDDIPEAKE